MMRLLRFLLGWHLLVNSESYCNFSTYPASFSAFSYSSLAPPNTSSELKMELNLFWMDAGMFLRMDGGWLDALLTYLVIPLGFLYGF